MSGATNPVDRALPPPGYGDDIYHYGTEKGACVMRHSKVEEARALQQHEPDQVA